MGRRAAQRRQRMRFFMYAAARRWAEKAPEGATWNAARCCGLPRRRLSANWVCRCRAPPIVQQRQHPGSAPWQPSICRRATPRHSISRCYAAPTSAASRHPQCPPPQQEAAASTPQQGSREPLAFQRQEARASAQQPWNKHHLPRATPVHMARPPSDCAALGHGRPARRLHSLESRQAPLCTHMPHTPVLAHTRKSALAASPETQLRSHESARARRLRGIMHFPPTKHNRTVSSWNGVRSAPHTNVIFNEPNPSQRLGSRLPADKLGAAAL
ncbi:hypothetical protein K491DRAFT_675476 [Lophiostoma macrostomum CBS 122681]|uniref:Uncharacterized protein n=1 Tax=Lophiostoma macrostomum CBS 122681 TaxID=1314788 RepID=A0A6A6TID7_9PLEO|nr:hypothetical protein K491DRAFT_675476 [Lophiostoma macrostomum CBS 122681]